MVTPVSQQPLPPQPARPAPRQRILEVHDRAGWVVGAYRIRRDWPAQYAAPDLNAPDLDARGNDVTIDQITLTEEGLGVDSASSRQPQESDATDAAQDTSGSSSPTGHKP